MDASLDNSRGAPNPNYVVLQPVPQLDVFQEMTNRGHWKRADCQLGENDSLTNVANSLFWGVESRGQRDERRFRMPWMSQNTSFVFHAKRCR